MAEEIGWNGPTPYLKYTEISPLLARRLRDALAELDAPTFGDFKLTPGDYPLGPPALPVPEVDARFRMQEDIDDAPYLREVGKQFRKQLGVDRLVAQETTPLDEEDDGA
jgi:hypothetical protein